MREFKKHVIIVGTARSGTSWLSETIAQQYRYRMLFEPEHETQTKKGYLLCDQWIQYSEERPQAYAYLKKIFSNCVDSDWIAQNSNRSFKRHLWPFIPKKYIIKFVRANLAAKYMNDLFQIPVIHIIRNPYDVIRSQQRANFPWLTDLSHFVNQRKLVELIVNEFGINLTNYETYSTIEKLALRWCIENVIPLEVLEPYQHLSKVIRYEELKADVSVFETLCQEFNLEPVPNIVEIYRRPSTKTHKNSVIKTKKESIQDWSAQDLNQINSILNLFKTKLYPLRISK